MSLRRAIVACLSLLLVAGCSASGGGGGTRGAPPTVTDRPAADCFGSAPGEQVVVYSMIGLEYWYADVLTKFQTDCAVQVAYVGLSPTDLVARLADERQAPLADIVIAPAPQIEAAAEQGLLAPGPVAGVDKVATDRCGRSRAWCEIAEDYASWVFATASLAPPPTTYLDLLSPTFAGKLQYGPPDRNDGALAMITLLQAEMGDGAAFGYLTQLEANVGRHEVSTDAMSKSVAAGQALAAGGDLQEHLNDLIQYPGLTIWFPGHATLAIPIGAARAAPGPGANRSDLAAAQALLARLWSDPDQADLGAADLAPARPEVVPTDERSQLLRAKLQGITIERVAWDGVVHDLPTLLQRWNALRTAPVASTAIVPTTTIPTTTIPTTTVTP